MLRVTSVTDPAALALSPQLGPLLENFAVQELRRHLRWADTAATAWHFRTAAGREVDLVLETPSGRVVGIEVKASASITQGDFDGLRELALAAGEGFARGVVLYTGVRISAHPGHRFQPMPDSVSDDRGQRFRLIPDRVSA